MSHPDDVPTPDLSPELSRRLQEVEQLLRESGSPDPDQPEVRPVDSEPPG